MIKIRSFGRIHFKFFVYLLGTIAILQLFIFNIAMIYAYYKLRYVINDISQSDGITWLDKLSSSKAAGKYISYLKYQGLNKLIGEFADRVYFENIGTLSGDKIRSLSGISQIGFDVSNSGEVLFIYKRILLRSEFAYTKLIIDIGANDGLVSSNSYNFVRWGWDAILVEPVKDQLQLAKTNLKKYISQRNCSVHFVNAVVSAKDGEEDIVVAGVGDTETHILDRNKDPADSEIMTVDSISVKTLTNTYKVPRRFGILSIDAEGKGDIILHHWMELGYRPAYIIYEYLHNKESPHKIIEYLKTMGYDYLIRLGYNMIYEHRQ